MNTSQTTYSDKEIHFVVMAIGAAAQKMGISLSEMYNRLKK